MFSNIFLLIIFIKIINIEGYTVQPFYVLENETVDYKTSEPNITDEGTFTDEAFSVSSTILLKNCLPCLENVLCVPKIQCPAHVRMRDIDKPYTCDLPGKKIGYCCLSGQNHTADHESSNARFSGHQIHILPKTLMEETKQSFHHLLRNENEVPLVTQGHPTFIHGLVFQSTPQDHIESFQSWKMAMEQTIAAQIVSQQEQIPVDDLITNRIRIDLHNTPFAPLCQPQVVCLNPNLRYRSFDGNCNNMVTNRFHWGSAGQPMERLLPPAYEDGIWKPRMHGRDGIRLPGARAISRLLMQDIDRPHPHYNLMLMQFGQFLAHDIMQSGTIRTENGGFVECCTANRAAVLPPQKRHFACLPIEVDSSDDFYGPFQVRCLNFVRLSLAPSSDCTAGYAKQRNKVTHFIDASQVYGSNLETARELRTFHGGRLKMLNDFGRDLLPMANDHSTCPNSAPGNTCFKSGDGRTNQIVSLTALHILFAREHNRIAVHLERLNSHLSDEIIFRESRRILIAEMQHIVYNEYLPAIIGHEHMIKFRLQTRSDNSYSPDINPAITNEFAGAAFRIGHSNVDGKFIFNHNHDHRPDAILPITDVMFNPSHMRIRTFYDDMLQTLLAQPMQQVDRFITHGLSRFLFRGHNPFGLDLAAINIQRGRDHALRSYNDYLELIGKAKIQNFGQLPLEVAPKLAALYGHVDDIDLWVGGLLEAPVNGGSVGETFAEIIADQFSRLKRGDRYFYDYNSDINPGAFTPQQLEEIRKVTMARLICDNADHITLQKVSPHAFIRNNLPGNQQVDCRDNKIPKLDFNPWRNFS